MSADHEQRTALLGIYLNDHLAGATGGVELLRRTARARRGAPAGAPLERLAAEVTEDRAALTQIMDALGVKPQRVKVYVAWAAEKAGRLKPNGRVVRRSPLSDVLELEAMLVGVHGKAALWRTLLMLAPHERSLDPERLNELLQRAERQAAELEELRAASARDVLGRS